jgi:hypothetical protein
MISFALGTPACVENRELHAVLAVAKLLIQNMKKGLYK